MRAQSPPNNNIPLSLVPRSRPAFHRLQFGKAVIHMRGEPVNEANLPSKQVLVHTCPTSKKSSHATHWALVHSWLPIGYSIINQKQDQFGRMKTSLCISYHFVILAQHQSWMNSVIMTHVKNGMPIVSNTVSTINHTCYTTNSYRNMTDMAGGTFVMAKLQVVEYCCVPQFLSNPWSLLVLTHGSSSQCPSVANLEHWPCHTNKPHRQAKIVSVSVQCIERKLVCNALKGS